MRNKPQKPMPPVPPAGRTRKGPGGATTPDADTAPKPSPRQDTDDRGDHGRIKQNTRNQGYQQDR
jgi:hypothetical protein